MPAYPKFSVAFEISGTDADRMQAFELYQKAFGAKKVSEFNPPGSNSENLHIVMEIGGSVILLHPSKEKRVGGAVGCQVYFDSEASLQSAYEVLRSDGETEAPASWPHALLSVLVTDRYGVNWWLHT